MLDFIDDHQPFQGPQGSVWLRESEQALGIFEVEIIERIRATNCLASVVLPHCRGPSNATTRLRLRPARYERNICGSVDHTTKIYHEKLTVNVRISWHRFWRLEGLAFAACLANKHNIVPNCEAGRSSDRERGP